MARSFSERLPPCLKLPGALAGTQGLMAVVGGRGGSCIPLTPAWGTQGGFLGLGALSWVSLSATRPFQGDICCPLPAQVSQQRPYVRSPGTAGARGRLSLPCHGSCTPLP